MPKIGDLGRVPKDWRDNASRKTFLQPWPDVPGTDVNYLEPYGNPAYEGYGYPAAGYGVTRRKVVGLEFAKVNVPQLTNNGWEGKAVLGTRITPKGSLNLNSDRFTRAELAVLQGLRGLGQVMTPEQAENLRMAQAERVLQEADRLIVAMKKQIDSPPWGTPSSTMSGWRTAYNTANNVRDRLASSRFNAVKSNEQFKKWLDAGNALLALGLEVASQYDQNGLINALKYTAYQTAVTVGEGVVETGKRTLTILDWLTNPYVLVPVGIGLAGLYVFAKGGGSIIGGRR